MARLSTAKGSRSLRTINHLLKKNEPKIARRSVFTFQRHSIPINESDEHHCGIMQGLFNKVKSSILYLPVNDKVKTANPNPQTKKG